MQWVDGGRSWRSNYFRLLEIKTLTIALDISSRLDSSIFGRVGPFLKVDQATSHSQAFYTHTHSDLTH